MKLWNELLPMALIGVPATASGVTPAVDVGRLSQAVATCAKATSKLGVDDRPFRAGTWAAQTIAAPTGDRFYAKGEIHASLGSRRGVGGSCIISVNVRSPYDLTALTDGLERAFHVKALVSGSAFSLLPLPGKVVVGRVTPTPAGSVVSMAVEMRD